MRSMAGQLLKCNSSPICPILRPPPILGPPSRARPFRSQLPRFQLNIEENLIIIFIFLFIFSFCFFYYPLCSHFTREIHLIGKHRRRWVGGFSERNGCAVWRGSC